jgi:hypothetical protein
MENKKPFQTNALPFRYFEECLGTTDELKTDGTTGACTSACKSDVDSGTDYVTNSCSTPQKACEFLLPKLRYLEPKITAIVLNTYKQA